MLWIGRLYERDMTWSVYIDDYPVQETQNGPRVRGANGVEFPCEGVQHDTRRYWEGILMTIRHETVKGALAEYTVFVKKIVAASTLWMGLYSGRH